MSQLRKSRAKVVTPWAARVRDKNEATPQGVNTMRSDIYVSSKHNPPPVMRPGAMDYAKHASLGFRV